MLLQVGHQLGRDRLTQQRLHRWHRLPGQIAPERIGRPLVPALQRAVGIHRHQRHRRRVVDAVQLAGRRIHLRKLTLQADFARGSLTEEAGDPHHQARARHHLQRAGRQDRQPPRTLHETEFQHRPAQQRPQHPQPALQPRKALERHCHLHQQRGHQQNRYAAAETVCVDLRHERKNRHHRHAEWRHILQQHPVFLAGGQPLRVRIDEHPVQQPHHRNQRQRLQHQHRRLHQPVRGQIGRGLALRQNQQRQRTETPGRQHRMTGPLGQRFEVQTGDLHGGNPHKVTEKGKWTGSMRPSRQASQPRPCRWAAADDDRSTDRPVYGQAGRWADAGRCPTRRCLPDRPPPDCRRWPVDMHTALQPANLYDFCIIWALAGQGNAVIGNRGGSIPSGADESLTRSEPGSTPVPVHISVNRPLHGYSQPAKTCTPADRSLTCTEGRGFAWPRPMPPMFQNR